MIQALVMVQVDFLILAVANVYRYGQRHHHESRDFDLTKSVAETLYGHSRFRFPYNLAVLGY